MAEQGLVRISTESPIWDKFFMVASLALVGTKEPDGSYDLAPKHMSMPLGWQNYWCFVCSPHHGTYTNIVANLEFTASFPRPESEQIVETSLAAAPRAEDATKPSLAVLPTMPATAVEGVLVEGCALFLECELDQILDGFGENSLIIGRIVAASVDERSLRSPDKDDEQLIYEFPLLAYLPPGRFGRVAESLAFPFPVDFRR